MTTTYIQFAEKQDFETIKSVIEKEFTNVKNHKKISDLDYISFDYKGENIYCHFLKDNIIHGKDNAVTKCSSLASDRPNATKTEAFKIIAKHFNCRFWENDCDETDSILYFNVEFMKDKTL